MHPQCHLKEWKFNDGNLVKHKCACSYHRYMLRPTWMFKKKTYQFVQYRLKFYAKKKHCGWLVCSGSYLFCTYVYLTDSVYLFLPLLVAFLCAKYLKFGKTQHQIRLRPNILQNCLIYGFGSLPHIIRCTVVTLPDKNFNNFSYIQ